MTRYELDTPVGKVEVHRYGTHRTAFLHDGRVAVQQYTDMDGNGTLEEPRVQWSNGSHVPKEADEFVKHLTAAVGIAEEWTKDTGKPFSSLKLPEVTKLVDLVDGEPEPDAYRKLREFRDSWDEPR